MKTADLKRHAVGAAIWSLIRTGGDQVIRFALFVYMARMLTPRDFGVFAVASIFVEYGRVIASAGLSEAVVQTREEPDQEVLSTLFWAIVATTAAMAALLAAGSAPLTELAGVPGAQPFMLALAGSMLLTPLSSIHTSLAIRHFRNRQMTINTIVARLAAALAAVIALHQGLGLWSLVVQQVVGGVAGAVLTWVVFPWTPGLRFSMTRLGSVWRFSGNMLLARLLQMSVQRVQEMVAARFLGPASLGQFRVGGRMFDLLNSAFIGPISGAALPTLARLQHDDPRFHNAYARMIGLSCLVACPASFGFAAVAQDAVPLIFGPRWGPTIPVVYVLALLAPASVLASFAAPALAARGRSDVTVKFATMQFLGTTVLSLLAVQFGIVALAGAFVLRSYMTLPVQLRMFTDATAMPLRRISSAILPSIVASATMVAAVLFSKILLEDWSTPVRLTMMILIGVLAYIGILLAFFRTFLRRQLGGLPQLRG